MRPQPSTCSPKPHPGDATASRHQGVAYAANVAGEVVRPHTAPRGEPYTCLLCQEPVILRRGLVRVPHFAHRADSACSASGESIEHAAFKRLLASGLRKHRRFTAQAKCPGCGQDQTTTYPLSQGSEVREEVTVGEFRADVGIVRGGEVVLAFEVYVTHEVGGQKALGLPVPWLEVAANPAGVKNLEKKPTVRALDTNLFRHRPCRVCGQSAGSRAEAEHLKLLAQEADWREQEADRKARETEGRKQRVERRARAAPARPPSWITPFLSQYADYRAPLWVTVLGVRLLMHPSLLPTLTLSEAPGGRYVFRQYALRFIDARGQESYIGSKVGPFLEELLTGGRPVTEEAADLLEEVRRLVEAGRQGGALQEASAEVTPQQPTLWG